MNIVITVANESHCTHASAICEMMEEAAKVRGTGIARRKPEYLISKIEEGKAVIALYKDKPIGFCYIENWEGQKYVANSGLIVHPTHKKTGLAKAIKKKTFELSQQKFPEAKLFGITTSMAVMKINSDLGYKPVTFSELTKDQSFWEGCNTCSNYDILLRTNKQMCLCTGMVCDFKKIDPKSMEKTKKQSWEKFKRFLRLRKLRSQRKANQNLKLNEL